MRAQAKPSRRRAGDAVLPIQTLEEIRTGIGRDGGNAHPGAEFRRQGCDELDATFEQALLQAARQGLDMCLDPGRSVFAVLPQP